MGVFILWIFSFLSGTLIGNYFGARRSEPYGKIHLSKSGFMFGCCFFLLPTFVMYFTTPASIIGGIIGLVLGVVGIICGYRIGKSTYYID